METVNPFDSFINLVKFDQETIALNKNIELLKKEMQQLQDNLVALNTSLDIAKNQFLEAQKEVHLQELRMQELQNKEREKKNLLENAASSKEYVALKKEVENLQRSQHAYEDELVNSWNKQETAKNNYETLKTALDEKSTILRLAQEEKNTKLTTLLQDVSIQKEQRQTKLQGIPQEWLDKYNVMHLQVSNPVVPLVGDSCSACFQPVTQQELFALSRKKMLQCAGCFRLLYLQAT